ncbi:class III lanthipeptide [Prescottella equi]
MSNILALQEIDSPTDTLGEQDTLVYSWSTLSFAIC